MLRRLDRVAASAARHAAALDGADLTALESSLHWDRISEYDARFFSDHVRTLDIEFSPLFCATERRWAYDELLHFEGYQRVHAACFGSSGDELADRRADFEPLAQLFVDEFTIACLCAYDELVTVRAYRSVSDLYRKLGSEVARFTRDVIAEEGRHYGGFLSVIRQCHAHRLHEVESVVGRIRASEGTPYAATFVLDHDDAVFDERMYDEAAELLIRHSSSSARRASLASACVAPAPSPLAGMAPGRES